MIFGHSESMTQNFENVPMALMRHPQKYGFIHGKLKHLEVTAQLFSRNLPTQVGLLWQFLLLFIL